MKPFTLLRVYCTVHSAHCTPHNQKGNYLLTELHKKSYKLRGTGTSGLDEISNESGSP